MKVPYSRHFKIHDLLALCGPCRCINILLYYEECDLGLSRFDIDIRYQSDINKNLSILLQQFCAIPIADRDSHTLTAVADYYSP